MAPRRNLKQNSHKLSFSQMKIIFVVIVGLQLMKNILFCTPRLIPIFAEGGMEGSTLWCYPGLSCNGLSVLGWLKNRYAHGRRQRQRTDHLPFAGSMNIGLSTLNLHQISDCGSLSKFWSSKNYFGCQIVGQKFDISLVEAISQEVNLTIT